MTDKAQHTGDYIDKLNPREQPMVTTDYYHWLYINHTGHKLHDKVLYLAECIKDANKWGIKRGWPSTFTMDTLSTINDHFYFMYVNGVLEEPVHLED